VEIRQNGGGVNHSTPEPPVLTPWGRLLVSQLRSLLANDFQRQQVRQYQRFEKLLDRLSDAAEDVRAHKTAEFEDYLGEHNADLRLAKDDCSKELLVDVELMYAKGKQECLDIHEELTQMLEDTFGEMCDRIETIKRVELKKLVAAEVKKQERRRSGAGTCREVVTRSLSRAIESFWGEEGKMSGWIADHSFTPITLPGVLCHLSLFMNNYAPSAYNSFNLSHEQVRRLCL
jgi:hypothetical protein